MGVDKQNKMLSVYNEQGVFLFGTHLESRRQTHLIYLQLNNPNSRFILKEENWPK